MENTIEWVVRNNLCTQCGTCVGLCPRQAIRIKLDVVRGLYVPQIDFEKCSLCGLCFRVCPGHEVDFPLLNRRLFGADGEDRYLFNLLDCYVGHAADKHVRHEGASGGMVTALLKHAFESGLIDGALVTRNGSRDPLRPEPFLARNSSDLSVTSGSRYCPVPINIALGAIKQRPGRYAVVGLPCHIHGIRKAAEFEPELAARIVLHIGLFCDHSLSFAATDYLLARYGIARNQVAQLDYRSGGWPGGIRVQMKDGRKIVISHFEAWKIFDVAFSPWRCLLCRDGQAELADISFGDAWLEEFSKDSEGISIIVTRTQAGDSAFRSLVKARGAGVKAITSENVAVSQRYFVSKKEYLSVYRAVGLVTGRKLPKYEIGPDIPRPQDVLAALVRLIGCLLSARPWTRRYLRFYIEKVIPFPSIAGQWIRKSLQLVRERLTRFRH